MKYLADQDVPRPLVVWLRNRGDDVRYAAEERPRELDVEWLRLAEADGRLLITADKDFGELVFRDSLNSHGIVLLRLGKLPMDARRKRLEKAWTLVEANPKGCFIVITPQRVRVRPLSC